MPVETPFVFTVVNSDPTPSTQVFASVSEAYHKASGFLQDVNYAGWANNIKTIFFILTLIFIGIGVFAFIKAHLLVKSAHGHHGGGHGEGHGEGHDKSHAPAHHEAPAHAEHSPLARDDESWASILQFANSIRESEWKLSIIEADKFVDDALKKRGFPGESMGERLMMISPDDLQSLQDLWDAHKLRNILVHEVNYRVKHEQVLGAIHAFERVLKELGVIS